VNTGLLALLHVNGEMYYIEDVPYDTGKWVVDTLLNDEDPEDLDGRLDVNDSTVFFGLNYDAIVAAEWRPDYSDARALLSGPDGKIMAGIAD
jgi:hypothetical protein